ncbi:MAG: purine-binding chemotaxis protein CheW [Devosia sp.]|uniref:chemotaxis protein CheW n=1 Tax=Devosia sp. TaxID=1871048 RepID=UPI0024CB8F49|nr:chemotaxis protein CheW [Devosia sp.]UYO00604.1 MAG: purine-binding chemotaxis protein CheW [Devosia sp.]
MANLQFDMAGDGLDHGAGADARQYVTFRCAGQLFGIDIMSIREIRTSVQATPLPAQKRDMLGVIDIRGQVVPIHDLALRIGCQGVSATSGTGQVILVMSHGGQDMGLLVDSVSDIVPVTDDNLLGVPEIEGNSARFLSAVARAGDQLIFILDEASVRSHSMASPDAAAMDEWADDLVRDVPEHDEEADVA